MTNYLGSCQCQNVESLDVAAVPVHHCDGKAK